MQIELQQLGLLRDWPFSWGGRQNVIVETLHVDPFHALCLIIPMNVRNSLCECSDL